jgi:hypothetical protein
LIPDGPADVLVTVFKSRSRKQMCLDSVPECIKKQRVGHVFVNLKDKKAQRALEKEIPYSKISQDQMPAFQEAIRKEWQSWQEFHAAEPLSLQESEKVIQELPQRVLRSRYVLRNKNAGLVDDKGSPLALRAKARLCIQGQFDPDSASGNIQLDAPTVQHTSLLVFLHCVISFGWLDNWFSGDISSAFLQGNPHQVSLCTCTSLRKGFRGVTRVRSSNSFGQCMAGQTHPEHGMKHCQGSSWRS